MMTSNKILNFSPDKAMALALRLVQAEHALHEQSHGQIDAVVDLSGNTHLLHAAQERLRLREQALAAISQGVLICDEHRLATYANTTFSALTGFPESEILGRNCSFLQGPETNPETVLAIRRALDAGETFDGEILNYRKNGEPFWNELSITPLLGTTGQAIRFIGVQRDVTQRKQTELALKESESRYRSLFDNMTEGFASCRILFENGQASDFVYLEINGAFETLTGLKDAVGKKISELIPGIHDANPELLTVYARVASGGHPEKFETYLAALGIWLSVSVYSSQKDHFVAVFDNITEAKEAALKLNRERSLLRTLIDSIPDLIFLKNANSEFIRCNKAFERRFDCVENEIIGLTDYAIVPGESAEVYRQQDQALFISGNSQRSEDWIPSPDGRGAFFETVKTPYYGPSGESLGLVGVSRDLTERNQAKENQRILTERLNLAVTAGEVGIYEMDVATQKMECDAQMRILYGFPAEGDINAIEQFSRVVHVDDLPRLTIEFENAVRFPERPLSTEYRIIRANDGCTRVIRSMSTVIRNDAGVPVRIVGANWDVTDERTRERDLAIALEHEKELLREAQAGNRAKSDFLAVMSHEIRTPMNGILGFSELLATTPELPEDCLDYAKTIRSSGEALLRILDDILDFSRIEASRIEVEIIDFCPRDIVQNIHDLLAPRAKEKALEFKIVVDHGIPDHFWNDAGRLRQSLLNLTSNAIKFTESGSVTLGLRKPAKPTETGQSKVEFFVRDTGPGIPDKDIQRIFKPFAQADSSISRKYGGTGLGLSISQNFVKLMGGELTVSSQVGSGSEFVVTLPSLSPPSAPLQRSEDSPAEPLDKTFAEKHPLRILVVEDDRVNTKLMLLMLRKLGYEPSVACDGIEAVEVSSQTRPDCILMDIQMPRKDGLHATMEIRTLEKANPGGRRAFITALTANILAETRTQCRDAGMDAYLSKPIKLTLLANTLVQASHTRPLRLP